MAWPSGSGVCHQRHVVAHVPVVLGDRDGGEDRSFPRGHRHVRGVGDQDGALHQGLAGSGVRELGELEEHVGHLVAALPAADVHDDVRIRPLGELVLDHGLAAAEGTRHAGRAALGHGEEGVEHALPGDQRNHGVELPAVRASAADGPPVRQLQVVHRAIGAGDVADRVAYGVAAGGQVLEHAHHTGRHHDPVPHDVALLDVPEPGASLDRQAGFHGRYERPPCVLRDGRLLDAPRDEISMGAGDDIQGPLDAIVDLAYQTRPDLHG
jgi:hypothetical protein